VEINDSVFSLRLNVTKLSADRVRTESGFQMSAAEMVKERAGKEVRHRGC